MKGCGVLFSSLLIGLASLGIPLAGAADLPSDAGTQVSVSLANQDLPASDLVYAPNGQSPRILNPAEAWELKKQGLDLSTLDPDPTTDIWTEVSTEADQAADEALPIQSDDTTGFFGVISSSSGRFRFNVQLQDGSARTLTLMISKELHTTLLRKELLRRLGYRIPAMKYLPQVKVRFADAMSRDLFLRTQVPTATFGAASRWCSVASSVLAQDKMYPCISNAQETDPLRVTLQDVVAMDATPLYYNTALGPPIELIDGTTNIRPQVARLLRALAIPYGLANIAESMNQVDWHVGLNQNGAYKFSVTDEANFSCSLDDARWIEKRISKLTRQDYQHMVASAFYPEAVAKVLVEKLVARRDSLNTAFNLNDAALPFDPKISDLPDLKSGKILKQEWPGYASRFAWGDPESPLRGLRWYVLSEVQSNVMETLLSKANGAIPQLTQASQMAAHAQKLQQALGQYMANGTTQVIPFGVWAAPIVGGGLDLSRDVVIGEYLGTNNIVSLVDNFGFNVNVGVVAGVDGLPVVLGASAVAQLTAAVELTHVKPLKSLKSAVTEPLRNELVPILTHGASELLKQTAAYGAPGSPTQTPDQLKKALSDTLDRLKTYLGVGESLILTESLAGIQKLSLNAGLQTFALPGAGIEGDANQLVLARLHVFRRDQNTIQVFQDRGQLIGAHVAFEFTLDAPASFPLISLSAQKIAGSARSKIFSVNINPDPLQNPGIYTNASALASLLRTSSVEMLEAAQKPTLLSERFTESQTSHQFFHLIKRTLKSNGRISIQLPDGTSGDYISLSTGLQKGAHYQLLATQAATYLEQKLTGDPTLMIDTSAAPDPGHSFLGHSTTASTEVQARVDGNQLEVPMARMEYRWEGWNISAANTVALVNNLSKEYGFKLYPDGFLADTQSIKLYEIDLFVNLYQSAFNELLHMTPEQEDELVAETTSRHHCRTIMIPPFSKMANIHACRALKRFRSALRSYRSGKLVPQAQAINFYNLTLDLEEFVDFGDLVKIVGANHLYVYSVISGFRIGSETLSDPIRSNTFGTADPDNPDGILDAVERIIGIDDGEFKMQWIRGVL